MAGELLSVEDATAIVKAQETRLRDIVASWRLAFIQRPQSIIPCYDTLVIEVFDIFHPDRMRRPSQSTQDVLTRLQVYSSGVLVEPIERVIRLQLAKTGNETKDMLAYVTSQLLGIDEAQQGSVLQLTGLELVGRRRSWRSSDNLKVIHLKPLQRLCVNLPQSMSLALRFSHKFHLAGYLDDYATMSVVQVPKFGGFLKRACGFQGSEFAGLLEVLDLVGAFNQPSTSPLARHNFAALCTLLPFSRCLREVRVTISDTDDLLWLAYAMFHPQSRHSAWRALVLCFDFRPRSPTLDWPAVDRFMQAGANLPALLGDRVRAVTVSTFDPRDSIAVTVPGYGIGYTARSYLSAITETEQSDPPTSCITNLYVAGVDQHRCQISPRDELGILRLFGPSLKVLRVSQLNWFQQRGISQYLPQLETLDGCRILVNTHLADLVTLPKLRVLGLECGYLLIKECFRDLLIPCAWKLQELRVSLHMSADDVPRVEALLRQCLGRLVHVKLDIKLTSYNGVYGIVTMDNISTIIGRSKFTFLGAVQGAQTRSREKFAALGRLDSNLIRIVFDFCGPGVKSLIVAGADPHGRESPTPHEMDTEGDAWNDRFADE